MPSADPIRLSLAAPAFNEAEGIGGLIQHWHDYLANQSEIKQFEIVICNDGSQDTTRLILETLALSYPAIRPIHFDQNQGAASALQAAISQTQFEWVLLLDADDQFPIENVSNMIATLKSSGALAVSGARRKKSNLFFRFGSKASGFICNLIHGSQMQDFNSIFKLVSGPLLRSFIFEAKGMNFSTEITSRLLERRTPIVEIEIEHRHRTYGKSKVKWFKDSLHRLLFVIYLAIRQLLFKLNILRQTHEQDG